MPPRILVFGTGAIGSVYTYLLTRSVPASNIVCVCRSNYDVLKLSGITINSSLWGNNLNVKPTIVGTVDEGVKLSSKPFDYIVITSKVLNTTPSTIDLIAPAVTTPSTIDIQGPADAKGITSIILIQNGIGIEKPYSSRWPDNPLVSGVVYCPATQTSPGTVEHKEVELLHLGTYPAQARPHQKAAAQRFTDLLTSCKATVKLHDDIQHERWSKLLVNAAWNPICALTRSRDAEFLKDSPIVEDETMAYIKDVMLEIASVAQAYGYKNINWKSVDYQMGRASVRDVPGIEPSMLADARGGRRMEVDAIVGNVLKMAREKELQTPLLRSLYLLLSGLDGSFARS